MTPLPYSQYQCHGADKLRTPSMQTKKCPSCGSEIEFFSTDTNIKCDNCGWTCANDVRSCFETCEFAKECHLLSNV